MMGVDMAAFSIQYREHMDGAWLDWADLMWPPRYHHWQPYVEAGQVNLVDHWYAVDFWSIDREMLEGEQYGDTPKGSPEYAAMKALAAVHGPNNVRLKWRLA